MFKLTPSGSGYTEALLHSFQFGSDSGYPAAGLMRKDGSLYGTTQGFCCPSRAVVFRLTPSRTGYRFKTLYTFLGAPDGDSPLEWRGWILPLCKPNSRERGILRHDPKIYVRIRHGIQGDFWTSAFKSMRLTSLDV